MMRKVFALIALFGLLLPTVACSPIERQAYRTVVTAKAFIDSVKAVHPECVQGAATEVCSLLVRATRAKDVVIDAAEIYCAGPDFETGGACNAPQKGTDKYVQATAKLQASLTILNQLVTDLKGVK